MHLLKAITILFFQFGQSSTSRVVGKKKKISGGLRFQITGSFTRTWQVESGSKIVVLRGLDYREGFTVVAI